MKKSLPGLSPVPAGDTIVATYHTHAGNFAVSDEYVSPGDIAKVAVVWKALPMSALPPKARF